MNGNLKYLVQLLSVAMIAATAIWWTASTAAETKEKLQTQTQKIEKLTVLVEKVATVQQSNAKDITTLVEWAKNHEKRHEYETRSRPRRKNEQ